MVHALLIMSLLEKTKVCDLLTWSDFAKILHEALFIGKVQRQTRADKIIALHKI